MKLWTNLMVVGATSLFISGAALADGPKCKTGFASVSCSEVDNAARTGFCWAEKKGEVSEDMKTKRCLKKRKALSKTKKKMMKKKKGAATESDES